MECKLGYKAFKKGLINQYGQTFEKNKSYTSGNPKFQKCGFHYCRHIEDVFRYYDGFSDDIEITLVLGYGTILESYDEYYDYEILTSSNFQILYVLTREDILKYAKNLEGKRLYRFVSGFRLNDDEIKYICENKDNEVWNYVEYYQKGNKNVWR